MKQAFLFVSTLSIACSSSVAAELTVAVAANVQYVFNDLRAEFKKETGHDLKPVYSSSGKLVAQIMNGAPFHVFLSADMEYPERLHQEGLTAAQPKTYAYGALVLWTTKSIDLKQWQQALTGPAVTRIALPNPKTAPYGREAIKVLQHFSLEQALRSKLVYSESISQANQYIHSKVADVGFTAKSVTMSPEMKGIGAWIELPKEAYQPIAQGAVLLKHGQRNRAKESQEFYDFLYSEKARKIFERYGYLLP